MLSCRKVNTVLESVLYISSLFITFIGTFCYILTVSHQHVCAVTLSHHLDLQRFQGRLQVIHPLRGRHHVLRQGQFSYVVLEEREI